MSKDLNPLSDYNNYTVAHIIVAFEFSRDAYTVNITPDIGNGEIGKVFNVSSGESRGDCGGRAVVIVNEMKQQDIKMQFCETEWNFFSAMSQRTTSYVGTMELVDRSGFLLSEKLRGFAEQIDTSIQHMTFAWVPIFVCRSSSNEHDEFIYANPMYFHVSKFFQNVSSDIGKAYTLEFVSCYNTHGLSPQFSKMYQTTVTHKEGNVLNTMPVPYAASSGIQPTRKEDQKKLEVRKSRLQLTKYMKNLGEVFSSLEVSIDNQKVAHKKQLQRLLSIFRNDYVEKLQPVKQTTESLPLDYRFDLDQHYKNKKINNRNLPFEQNENDQTLSGISSITFPSGSSLLSMIDSIMKMSKDVGKEHSQKPPITYKTTFTTERACDGNYKINVKIRKYESAYNSMENGDTGPGESAIDEVIEYSYQDGINRDDTNLLAVSFASFPEYRLNSMEIPEDSPDAQDIYGNREPIASQRFGDVVGNFFRRGFNGLRVITGLFTNSGLENPAHASNMTNFRESQQANYTLTITGNPRLLSDINRNPMDVVNDVKENGRGKYAIYRNIETDPMYIKLKLYLTGDDNTGSPETTDATGGLFYYQGYLHLYKIQNVFSDSGFVQYLSCARTEESI